VRALLGSHRGSLPPELARFIKAFSDQPSAIS
jgi:hypothetical protein